MCHSVTNTLSSRHHHPPTRRWRTLRECCEGLGDAQAPSHGAVVDANDRNSKQLTQSCKRKGHVSQPSIHSATRATHRSVRVFSRITACFQGLGWSRKSTEIRAGTPRWMAGRRARPREETRRGKAMVMGDDNVHYAWARILFIPCGSESREAQTQISPLGSHHHEDRDRDSEVVSDVPELKTVSLCRVSGSLRVKELEGEIS
ncbi:hypothetical protein C8R45DRAFT_1083259 [Mycena sanguinolenta]|nr:hypothetical protein C8R45DRAFT_1083259 [Mycena sanguinolenta]